MRTYHVGLLAKGNTAVYQYRTSKDLLSPEILEYLGKRETSKAQVKANLKILKAPVLKEINLRHPGRSFKNIVID